MGPLASPSIDWKPPPPNPKAHPVVRRIPTAVASDGEAGAPFDRALPANCLVEPTSVRYRPRMANRNEPPRTGRSRTADVPGAKNPYIRTRKPNKPKLELATTTLWSYPSQHYGNREQGSQNYKGATPSWVIWDVIQRFTKPGAHVVDPFCGSGTTLDVCADTERKGRGFDLAPTRDDIERADARALPLADNSVDLLFMDPPYADNLTYSDDPACIGKTRGDDGTYYQAMGEALEEASRVVRKGGTVAIYVQDIWQEKTQRFFPLGIALANIAADHFSLVDHVCVVRNNAKLSRGNHRSAALEGGFMMRGFNHLLLFRAAGNSSSAQHSGRKEAKPPSRPSSPGKGAAPSGRGGRGKSRGPQTESKPSKSGAGKPARGDAASKQTGGKKTGPKTSAASRKKKTSGRKSPSTSSRSDPKSPSKAPGKTGGWPKPHPKKR